MKLVVKPVDGAAGPNSCLALFTDEGEMLPLQVEASVSTKFDDMGTLVVYFRIDGDRIRLGA